MTDTADATLQPPEAHAGPSAGPPPLAPPPALPQQLPLRFTGTGGEYFRIWVVNLLLTIVTLGIYSAWAKVRKTQYFWSNTLLDGSGFQYHGRPGAILRGRLLVGAFFIAYSLAGRISVTAAVVASVVLGVLAPWFFFLAMRFKLTNTSWRGIRFGFDSSVGAAYSALAPGVILWVLLAAEVATLRPGEQPDPGPILVVYGLFLLFLPMLHARIKQYQHGAATYGSLGFEMAPSTGAFYKLYLKTLLVALGPLVLIVGAVVVATIAAKALGAARLGGAEAGVIVVVIVTYLAVLLLYLVAGSYFAAGLQRLVWARTRGGPLTFATGVATAGFLHLWLKNGLLTLLTLGLYWPYAAVALARYQVECMTLTAGAPLATLTAGPRAVEASAAGDGAVDLLGWDVGL